ncbi:MAG: four helix bundle protein [Bacteroidota bacterium]
MARLQRFQDLFAWQVARKLTRSVYMLTANTDFVSDKGLKSQIQRAAVSTMRNIAEGYARGTTKQFSHFRDISRGSAAEVQSLSYVAKDLNYINAAEFELLFNLSDETIAIISGLKNSLHKSRTP